MQIEKVETADLPRYGAISIAYETSTWLRPALVDGGLGGIAFREEPLSAPRWKDYDAADGEAPIDWPRGRFNVDGWELFIATDDRGDLGAGALVLDDPNVFMRDGRPDLGVLWDLRVAAEHRGQGIGAALFVHAADLARERGLRQIKIETQNMNPRACHFYHKQGCHLGGIERFKYVGHPVVGDEVQLLWYYDL